MSEAMFRSYTRSLFRRRVINLHERGDTFGASKGTYSDWAKIWGGGPQPINRMQPLYFGAMLLYNSKKSRLPVYWAPPRLTNLVPFADLPA